MIDASQAAQRMEQVVRRYIHACNRADAMAISEAFVVDAVHYFPDVGKWSGCQTIGNGFATRVTETGQWWTVDGIVADVSRHSVVLEWTLFNPSRMRVTRGVDWFAFDPDSLRIREVRCYYASPTHQDRNRHELLDFDYGSRGYPTDFVDPSREDP